MSLLEVRSLRRSFGGVDAVAGVWFEARAGEILAMIGPNGAGKSTCFNLIGGQVRPDAGSIRLAGAELVGLSPQAICRLGVARTFQIAATFASMTVRENVQTALLSRERRSGGLWRRAADLCLAEATALLERVGMAASATRACGVLAYGDLKRVELALALASRPRLLLMDEPTAGMAPRERAELMRLVVMLARDDGIGVLFTEHDMDIVFGHADRVIVLDHGRLVAAGYPDEIRADARVRALYLGADAASGAAP